MLRRAFDDDSGSASGPSGGSAPTTVICASELASACRALRAADGELDVTVEPAGATYERVVADPGSAPDVWLAFHPWPQMVSRAVVLGGGDDPFPASSAVASSDLAMVGRDARVAALTEHCGGTLGWRCVGDAAGQPWSALGGQEAWGVLKPSHADAAQSAIGLLAFSTVVSDYWGSTDYTGTDLENDDAFLSWLGRFEGAVPTYGDAVNTPLSILLAQPRIDVVGTTVAEVEEKAGAQRDGLTVNPPNVQPAPKAEVVVAGGEAAAQVASRAELRDALSRAGWAMPPSGASSAPTGTGLPGPDVMIALRDLWEGVANR